MTKDCEYHKNKYKDVPDNEFCGKEGGKDCRYTYPVNTKKRAVSALSYARHAPDPNSLRECVRRHAKEKGWLDLETGEIKLDDDPPEVVEFEGGMYVIEKGHGDIVDIRPLN